MTKEPRAEVIHAVREEIAQTLSDVVFRRTGLGIGSNPGQGALETCAILMAGELVWDFARKNKELVEVKAVFPHF